MTSPLLWKIKMPERQWLNTNSNRLTLDLGIRVTMSSKKPLCCRTHGDISVAKNRANTLWTWSNSCMRLNCLSNCQFMARQCPSAAHNSPSVHFSACQSAIKYLPAYSFLWSFLDPLYSVLIVTRVPCTVNGPTSTGETWIYWKKSKVGPPTLKSPMKGLKHSSYDESWA